MCVWACPSMVRLLLVDASDSEVGRPLEAHCVPDECKTCTQPAMQTQAQCVVCNCWQHLNCAVSTGLLTQKQFENMASLDYVCDMCAPIEHGSLSGSLRRRVRSTISVCHEAGWSVQLGLGSKDATFLAAREVGQCHKKLLNYELPPDFCCQFVVSSFTHIHTHSRPFTLIHTHSPPFTHIHTHSRSFTHIHAHSHPFTPIHARSRPFTLIHTHSHTFTPLYDNKHCGVCGAVAGN